MDLYRTLATRLGIKEEEAKRYFDQHQNQCIVIKIGGNVFIDPHQPANDILINFIKNIILLKQCGCHPLLVHGGGPFIDMALKEENIPIKFVHGLRYTDSQTMAVVKKSMIKLNQQICDLLCTADSTITPLPLSHNFIKAVKANNDNPDLGWVGEPVGLVMAALEKISNTIPIISPLGFDDDGNDYNINGDHAAEFIAGALHVERLILMTNVAGVLDKNQNLIANLTSQTAKDLIADGTIHGGMIPKIKTAIKAIAHGTQAVAIIDGRKNDAVLNELFTDKGQGTLLVRKPLSFP